MSLIAWASTAWHDSDKAIDQVLQNKTVREVGEVVKMLFRNHKTCTIILSQHNHTA